MGNLKSMLDPIDPVTLARKYHDAMPLRIREYLNRRGIVDEVIDLHLLGWSEGRITIPIFNREGNLVFFKLAKDPADQSEGPKMLAPAGTKAELYGWERLRGKPPRIVICEGEFDRLALESRGIAAVTSTGGAGVFRRDWAEAFREIPDVYICFDRDEAGRRGVDHVARLVPHAKIVELPEGVGPGGDVTDFFMRLEGTREEFFELLSGARQAPSGTSISTTRRELPKPSGDRSEVDALKASVSVETVITRYVLLARSGSHLRGRCPFHDDRIPSFVVYPENQAFHCFGCGAHGDVLEFLMMVEKVPFREALERLRSLGNENHGRAA